MTAERWKAIPGYEGLYEVSDHGRVRGLDRLSITGRRRHGQILSPRPERGGRVSVALCRDGRRKSHYIHQLMLEAFVGPRPEGALARHLDDNPRNNTLGNLKWGTQSENMFDSIRNGTHVQARKTHCPRGHEYSESNTYTPPGKYGRMCRTCARERARKSYQTRKAK